jgi:hypothetical protein
MRTPALDLRFQPFHAYLVLGKGKHTAHGQFWVCQCQCNTQVELHQEALVDGRAMSCGCDYRDRRGQPHSAYRDLTGQQFGQYLVLGRDQTPHPGSKAWWRCRCMCGQVTSQERHSLLHGDAAQCRRCADKAKEAVQVGRWYGSYFVLERVANASGGHLRYQCRCHLCEREKIVGAKTLLGQGCCDCGQRGRTTSILHTTVGRWSVMAFVGHDTHGRALYRCQCSCPARTIRDVRVSGLLSSRSQSCGCLGQGRQGTRASARPQPRAAPPPQGKSIRSRAAAVARRRRLARQAASGALAQHAAGASAPRPCSKCNERPRSPGQRWCQPCRNAFKSARYWRLKAEAEAAMV